MAELRGTGVSPPAESSSLFDFGSGPGDRSLGSIWTVSYVYTFAWCSLNKVFIPMGRHLLQQAETLCRLSEWPYQNVPLSICVLVHSWLSGARQPRPHVGSFSVPKDVMGGATEKIRKCMLCCVGD